MKKLEDFRIVMAFLESEGIHPAVAVFQLNESAWMDLVLLATEWGQEQDALAAKADAELALLTEDEIAERERQRIEQERHQKERVLFHSSGFRPGRR